MDIPLSGRMSEWKKTKTVKRPKTPKIPKDEREPADSRRAPSMEGTAITPFEMSEQKREDIRKQKQEVIESGPSGMRVTPEEADLNAQGHFLSDAIRVRLEADPTITNIQLREEVQNDYIKEIGSLPSQSVLDQLLSIAVKSGSISEKTGQYMGEALEIGSYVAGSVLDSQSPAVRNIINFGKKFFNFISGPAGIPIRGIKSGIERFEKLPSPIQKGIARSLRSTPAMFSGAKFLYSSINNLLKGNVKMDPELIEVAEQSKDVIDSIKNVEPEYRNVVSHGISPDENLERAEMNYETAIRTHGEQSKYTLQARTALVHANRVYLYDNMQDIIYNRFTYNDALYESVKLRAVSPAIGQYVAYPYQSTVLGIHGPMQW